MPEADGAAIWVYLSSTPLAGLSLTLLAYVLAHRLYSRFNANPLLNPVVTAVGIVVAVLWLAGIGYESYFEGGQFVHFLLGPATVALAVPLSRQLGALRRLWFPVSLAILVGVTTATISAVLIARFAGAQILTQLSLAPKSVTAPVAMGIAEQIGGIPSLTAVLVVATGILGALFGTHLLDLMNIRDQRVRGVAMGVAAHGIGTARAFQSGEVSGAFSGLAMALSALVAALIIPTLVAWFGPSV